MSKAQITDRIAQEAARLLAHDEAASVDAARRKAAARIGIKDPAQLPDDQTIRAALATYRALFGEQLHAPAAGAAEASEQRLELAIDAMHFMREFEPELAEADPALGAGQALRILIYSEDPDAPLHRLLDAGRRHRLRRERLIESGRSSITVDVLEVRVEEQALEFWPLPVALRGRILADTPHSDPLRRQSLAALRRRLAG